VVVMVAVCRIIVVLGWVVMMAFRCGDGGLWWGGGGHRLFVVVVFVVVVFVAVVVVVFVVVVVVVVLLLLYVVRWRRLNLYYSTVVYLVILVFVHGLCLGLVYLTYHIFSLS
jgi:hypothetical protein